MKHIITNSGHEFWFDENDNLYRGEDGPAVIHANGTEVWYEYNECNRKNNPAYIDIKGYEEWYQNGKRII